MTEMLLSPDMTPAEFKAWYVRLGLNQTDLAARLETTQPTVSKWLSGEHKIPGHLRLALERLEQILTEERRPKRRGRRRPTHHDRAGRREEGQDG